MRTFNVFVERNPDGVGVGTVPVLKHREGVVPTSRSSGPDFGWPLIGFMVTR